jgi:hypothetical protein
VGTNNLIAIDTHAPLELADFEEAGFNGVKPLVLKCNGMRLFKLDEPVTS